MKVTALPATDKGTLQLDGTAIASGDLPQTVTKADIDADKLIYTPPSNANGTPYTTFKFKVSDGTADSAEATMTVNVMAVNDAPTSADGTVTTNEDTAHTFSAGDFSFSDIDTGDALAGVKVTALPATDKGTLQLDGTAIASGDLPQTVTRADIDADKLTYTPPSNANGTPYTTFKFKVSDGTDDSAEATMTVNVAAVNDAPTVSGTPAATTDEDTAHTFSAGDFNFSAGDTGNTLAGVKVTALPATDKGTLQLDGTAIASGDLPQTVTKADIDADKLIYTPPSNANGTPYTTFKFKVSDGTADSAEATMTVNVAAVNDAPAVSGTPAVTTDEDTAHTFSAGDFSFSDIDTGDALAGVKVTALPATDKGTLQLDGAAIASGDLPQTVTRADIDADKLTYTPPSNANGTPYTTFKFKVSDGTDDSAEATMTVNVAAVSDAPAVSGTPAVTTDEDTAHTFSTGDFNFSAGDTGDALAGVKVTALPATDKGTLQLDGTAIASGDLPQTVTKADIDADKLTYTPPSNANGTPYTTFKFKVSDGTADSAEATMTVNVAAVNDAPAVSGTPAVTTNEDTAHTFSAGDFSFSDIDTGDALAGVKVTALPATDKGTLQLDGTAIASGDLPQTVTRADIDADKLTYTPPSNANGTPYTTFKFKVSDGTDDSAEATMTVNVAAVSDAPTVSGTPAVTTDEDTAHTFSAGDFNFSDSDTGDTLASVKVTALPATDKGTLQLDGAAIASGDLPQTVTRADIDADKLIYTPPSNANGTPYTTFKFKVSDGTADSAEATMTVNVMAVNDAPTSADGTVTTDEDTAHTFSADDFNFSDIDTGDALAGVKVTALPATDKGTLQLDGAAIASGDLPQTVTRADIDAGKLTYTPPSNANGTPYTTFKFKVSDGTDDSAEATMTVNVAAVSDAPTVSGTPAVTTDEDTAHTFSAGDFNFSAGDTGDTLAGVKVTALPATDKGTLQLDGTAIASGDLPQTVTKADIDADKLIYTPPSNANGTPYTTFKFKVSDGTDDSAEATMTVNVMAVNDAPTSADGTVTTNEDTAHTFSAGDFSFSDIDTGDALAGVKVTALPATDKGTLQLDGAAIASGDLPQTVTRADIDADKLIYTPPSNANGTPYTTFKFKVSDGTDDSAEATMTVNVAAVSDAPADQTLTVEDDDEAPTATLILSPDSIGENGGSTTVTASLSHPSSAETTITVAAAAVSPAVAADFTLSSNNTLTIAAGNTTSTGTVTITAVDNDADDPDKEVMVSARATNSQGVTAPADNILTIVDDEGGLLPEETLAVEALLARIGRTAASHVVDAVAARMADAQSGSYLTLAGQRLPFGDATLPQASAFVGQRGSRDAPPLNHEWNQISGEQEDLQGTSVRSITPRDLLTGSSFSLRLAEDDDERTNTELWTAWGLAAQSNFDGRDHNLLLNGDVTTVIMGLDAEWNQTMAGAAVAHSSGDGAFEVNGSCDDPRCKGSLNSRLTGVYPYLRHNVSERLSISGVLGYAKGDLAYSGDTVAGIESGTAAFSARGTLPPQSQSGFEFTASLDAFVNWMRAEETAKREAIEANTSRLRLALEASHTLALGSDRTLTSTMQLGHRHDGGDAETGLGWDVKAALRYADPARGLSAESTIYKVIAHEDADYEEQGGSASVRLNPDAEGLGPSLSLASSWSTGATRTKPSSVWNTEFSSVNSNFKSAQRLDAELGYGLPAFGIQGVHTPYFGFSLSDSGETTHRLGWRLRTGSFFTLNLESARHHKSDGKTTQISFGLQFSTPW